MSVQELNVVHRRYIRLSNHFKSAWTFHQFIQGLRKVFADLSVPDYPADFQNLYNELKEVADLLSANTADMAAERLERISQKLDPLIVALLQADAGASPELLRQFFQRVKNYDDNILSQLVKFYLYSDDGSADAWPNDRLDKADYLTTKLAETFQDWKDAYVLRDQTFIRELCQGLNSALGTQPLSAEAATSFRARIAELRSEMGTTESVDAVHDSKVLQQYRDFKHELGRLFFDPSLLPDLLAANIELKNHIQKLYRRDEQRIIAEYQQVFELERDVPIDRELSGELHSFRTVVERFEKQLEGDNIKIEDIAELRRQVRELVPKLTPGEDTSERVVPPKELRQMMADEHGVEPMSADGMSHDDLAAYVADEFRQVVEALDDTNSSSDAKRVALQPEVFGLGIKAREVVAYRRIYSEDPKANRELEVFLLRSCALRVRIEHEVEEIKGILDDTSVSRNAPVFIAARVTCNFADRSMRRLEHELEREIQNGSASEAKALVGLKMRMMRAFSGLWLMVHD